MMLGGPTRDRERFPRVVEQIGEGPARWLDRDVEVDDLAPLLRGIHSIERVRAWKAVERALDRGPRQPILDALEQREELLDEIGERHERNDRREIEDVPPVTAEYPDRPDVDEASDRSTFRRERAFGSRGESSEVATDGGEP